MMPGLREKQKKRREGNILDAATRLIEAKGWENTSMEEVAAQAEVGVATVYNYFGSRVDLVLAIFARYADEQIEAGRQVINNRPADAVDGMTSLFSAYIDGMAHRFGRKLIQEFFTISLSRQFSFGKDMMPVKRRFIEQVGELVEIYRQDGQICRDVSIEEAAMLSYAAVSVPLMLYVVLSDVALDDAKKAMHRNLQLIFRGLALNSHLVEGEVT
jgi:AcrR family transcriptional regulator